MKKFIPSLLLACALVVPAALSAAGFEGKVTMQISDASNKKNEGMDMDYKIKDQFVRIEMKEKNAKAGAQTFAMIMDSKKQEMTMLMAEQKMYMVMSMASQGGAPAARQGAAREPAGKAPDFKLEATGETETILGHKCEKYIIKDDKTTTALWLATDIGDFGGFGSGGGGGMMGMGGMGGMGGARGGSALQNQAWAAALQGKSLFPMRVVGSNAAGKETFKMEVTAIEKQSLPASDFAPPAGWQKFEMPSMGDMMKGMMPGMGR